MPVGRSPGSGRNRALPRLASRCIVEASWRRTQMKSTHITHYAFKDAETLLNDFFDEVERVLTEHGIAFEVVEVTEGDSL
jgi:hypothetical protein